MKKPNVKVLTIAVDNHFVFREALENWLSGGAELLSIGYNNANSDSYAGWYAIAKIPAGVKTTYLRIKPSEFDDTWWNVEGIDLGKEE